MSPQPAPVKQMPFNRSRLVSQLRKHRHVLVIVTLLTLVMTFPTIIYVFRTDVFWLPGGEHPDSFIKLWDVWYGELFLSGQADRFYTDLMFYPGGVSLAYHPFFLPYIMLVNVFSLLVAMPNAISLAYLVVVFTTTCFAYVYIVWLLNGKWIALLGAVTFGLSPHVVGHPYHIDTAWIATIPLVVYFFHRGVKENHWWMVVASGLLVGVTSTVILYTYVIVLMLLGFFVCGLGVARWRDKRYWLHVLLLVSTSALSSIASIYPLLSNMESLGTAMAWHGVGEIRSDALSFFFNYENPLFGHLFASVAQASSKSQISTTSFLGFVPLALIGFGLSKRVTRRKMLPWAFVCVFFLILRLGSHLNVLGVTYTDIRLPKFYLDQMAPSVFGAFWEVDNFMMGALLPLAVLACFGLVAIQKRFAIASKPMFILLLVALVAVEYWIPVQGRVISDEQVAFLDWLAAEEDTQDIRLINLPMGRWNSKLYNLYQALSGYPQSEGAISRTPDDAFDYVRANYLLNAWYDQRPVHCDTPERDAYLAGLTQLEQDGFSHVVFHRQRQNWPEVRESFQGIKPSYFDDFVSIYRLQDLRDSCPAQLDSRQRFAFAYAEALKKPSILDERTATVIIFPPTAEANDYFMRYLRVYSEIGATVVTVISDEPGSVNIEVSGLPDSDIDLEQSHALWLVNDNAEFNAERTAAYQVWFAKRFKFCARFYEDERITIDAYLALEYPCAAVDGQSPDAVRYDSGLRLHHASFDVLADKVRFYLAWTNNSNDTMAYSIQFIGEDGKKALQVDEVIYDQLLAVHEVETTALLAGAYSVQLIVYDFETRASQGGVISDTAERFERELQLGRLEAPG